MKNIKRLLLSLIKKKRRTLADDTVKYIRNSNKSQYELANELGISRANVGLIRQRKRYADVA